MVVRSIAPSDRDNYRSVLEDTTAEDRYCRFFHAVDHFDAEFIDQYVDGRHGTIGAIAFDPGPLGAAHAIEIDARTTELAIVVARGGRRRGIARVLLAWVIDAAAAAGYESLIAYALRENAGFTALARGAGMVAEPYPTSEGTTVVWRLDLQATRSPSVAR